jgi:hypothetical protein
MFETKRRRSLSLHPTPLIRDRDTKEREMQKKNQVHTRCTPPSHMGCGPHVVGHPPCERGGMQLVCTLCFSNTTPKENRND